MPDKLEIIVQPEIPAATAEKEPEIPSHRRDLFEIAAVFLLIMAAVWTPQGPLNSFFSLSSAACVLVIACAARWNSREMGLAQPLAGAGTILLSGAALCGGIWIAGYALRSIGPSYPVPWNRAWQYAIWALVQQFILQSIFLTRLETMMTSRGAVICAASLYAAAHVPSPLLTVLSFFGGVLFCELFRRWRNIFPLGIIHAALGLMIAANLPDKWLHHMRVGIGYLGGQHW
jgi:hypothetical protein